MTLFGTFSDLPLADFLHLLDANKLSGRLTLTTKQGHGVVVLRDGRVIYAATNGPRETFGSMLVHRKLISPSTLSEALAKQARSSEERRLGSVLEEMGVVDGETLRKLMYEQVGKVLKELMTWRHGYVRFEPLEIPERGEIAVDSKDFLLRHGLATERILFDVMSNLSSDTDDTQDRLLLDALTTGKKIEPGRLAVEDRSLKQIMTEIRSLQFTGEVTLNILRLAGSLVSRGALFLHSNDGFEGVGQYGFDNGDNEVASAGKIRDIRIPADEPSLFHDVAVNRETFVGPFEYRRWNVKLARALGGGMPGQVAVVPLLVNDQVHMVFYGDNHPGGEPIGDLEELELVMLQAGLAIEKAFLEKKLRSVENRPAAQPLAARGQ